MSWYASLAVSAFFVLEFVPNFFAGAYYFCKMAGPCDGDTGIFHARLTSAAWLVCCVFFDLLMVLAVDVVLLLFVAVVVCCCVMVLRMITRLLTQPCAPFLMMKSYVFLGRRKYSVLVLAV